MHPHVKALIGLVLALDALFIGWSCAVNQLHVVVVTRGPATVVLSDGHRSQTLPSRPAARDLNLTVTTTGPAIVHPLLSGSGALLSDRAEYQSSGFDLEGDLMAGGRWVALDGGAELRWSGRVAGLTVPLPCSSALATACVEGEPTLPRQCFDLSSCQGAVEVAVPSPAVVHSGLVPAWRTALTLESEHAVEVESATVRFGTHLVFERRDFGLDGSQRLDLPWSFGSALAELGTGVAQLLWQLVVLLAVMILGGLALVTSVVRRVGLLEALLLAFFVGQGLTANLTTAAYYFVSTSIGWPLVLAALAIAALVRLARGGVREWAACLSNTTAEERRTGLALVVVATVSCLVVAFPAAIFPGWYVGHGYTDSVDYPSWASLAHEAPVDRNLGAIRFQDFVRLALTAHTLGVDTRAGLAAQMLVLWWVFPFLAWATLRRLRLGPGAAVVGAVVAAHGVCLFEIATQCYLPHYEVAVFAAAGAWATLWLVDDERLAPVGPARRWTEAVTAAVFAAGVGLYPYHAFSVMAFAVGFSLVALARRRWSPWWAAVRVGLLTALFCNLNLEVILDFGQGSMQHRASLNAIGRNIVFPWYASSSAPAVLAGTDDFVRNSTLKTRLSAVVFAAMPRTGQRFATIEALVEGLVPAVTMIVIGLGLLAMFWVLGRGDRGGLVASLTLGLPVLMTLNLMRTGDVYFWVKSAMTLAALAVIPVAGLTARLVTSRLRFVAVLANAFVLAFVLVSLRTAWFDNLTYLLPRESPTLAAARTHLPVTGDSLWRFETFARALPHSSRFVLLGEFDDRYWSDGDRVTYNRVLQLLEGHQVTWGLDEQKRYTRSREVGYRGSAALDSFDYAISFDSCRPPERASVALTTEFFCVFSFARPSG